MEIAVSMEALDSTGHDTEEAVQFQRRTLGDKRLVEILSPDGEKFYVDADDLMKTAELMR